LLKWLAIAVAPLVAAIVGFFAFRGATRNWKAARVKILIDCHKAYGEISVGLIDIIEKEKATLDIGPPAPTLVVEAKKLFSRLWSLQYEQFVYFTEGQVPKRVFKGWLIYRYIDYRKPVFSHLAINLASTWGDRQREHGTKSEFVQFMDLAMDVNNPTSPNMKPDELAMNAEKAVERALEWYTRNHKRWTHFSG
jgi:hypothetical protein